MYSRWQSTIVDAQGNVQPHATLRIRKEQDQSLALVYRSNSDLQPYPLGLVAADINGFAYFYAPPGRYRIQSIDLDIDWRDVEIGALSTARAALENSGMTIYDTHADMMADAPSESPIYARVVNDADPGLNGYYIWNGSSWERTTAQPADAENVLYRNIPQPAPLLHDIPQSGVVNLPYDLDALQAAVRVLQYGDGPYPTLDLIFAGAQLLDPRVDFSRASTATGTGPTGRIFTAAIDEPRFVYDPATGQSEGLLVEGQATNLLQRSSEAWMAPWYHGGSTYFNEPYDDGPVPIMGETLVSFYGPQDGERSFVTSVSYQVVYLEAGTYSLSGLFKYLNPNGLVSEPTMRSLHRGTQGSSGSAGSILARLYEHGGTYGSSSDTGTEMFGETTVVSCYPLENGWYYYHETFEVLDAGTVQIRLFPYDGSSAITGDGSTGILRTMLQLEEGTRPTSYIPTEESQVTRAADNVSRELGEEFNAREFTLFVEFEYLPTDSVQTIAALNSDGSFANRLAIESSPFFRLRDGRAILPSIPAPALPSGKNKIAFTYTTESVVLAANGVITSQAAGDFSELADRLADQASVFLGENSLGGARQSGQYSRVTLYPRALSNEQLITLTS